MIYPTAIATSITLDFRAEAPPTPEPCPRCGRGVSQYHSGGEGCPVLRGPCIACQTQDDAEIRREFLARDGRYTSTLAEKVAKAAPGARQGLMRDAAKRVKAWECWNNQERACNRHRGLSVCDNCPATETGRELWRKKS